MSAREPQLTAITGCFEFDDTGVVEFRIGAGGLWRQYGAGNGERAQRGTGDVMEALAAAAERFLQAEDDVSPIYPTPAQSAPLDSEQLRRAKAEAQQAREQASGELLEARMTIVRLQAEVDRLKRLAGTDDERGAASG